MLLFKDQNIEVENMRAADNSVRQGWSIPVLKIAIITNHPPPFRIPVFERIAAMPGVDLQLFFCSRREPNREWELPELKFKHVFLRERFVTRGDNFIHNNIDIVPALNAFGPDVIVTCGFNPTYLYAFGYALARGVMHVPMTDGTEQSEAGLSRMHKFIRNFIYHRSAAFIAASEGGKRLYQSYGISPDRCFKSCLCIDNDAYLAVQESATKRYDLVFAGRMVAGKNPLFALRVARETAKMLGRRVSLLFVGSGEQEEATRQEAGACADLVDAHFHGFASQEELPALYRSARIFLFPTLADVWGVVANEACAAGLPVIVSPHAGAANEIVLDGQNGFVCELNESLWAERVALMLSHEAVYQRFCERSLALAEQYTFDHAAVGVVDACRYALGAANRRLKTTDNPRLR